MPPVQTVFLVFLVTLPLVNARYILHHRRHVTRDVQIRRRDATQSAVLFRSVASSVRDVEVS